MDTGDMQEPTEPEDAGAHEVPDDLLELHEALEAQDAGLLAEAGE